LAAVPFDAIGENQMTDPYKLAAVRIAGSAGLVAAAPLLIAVLALRIVNSDGSLR